MDPIPVQERPKSRPRISAVVPMFNEGRNATTLLRTLHDQLAALADAFEIVVVNDGSKDDTRERVLEISRDCAVHYVELSRNFGKENALRRLPERARFMKGLYAWVGFRSVPIEYEPGPRAGGRSAFGFGNLLRLAGAGLTSFSTLPLRAVSVVGALVSVVALGYGAWVVVEEMVYGARVPGYPTIVVSIMFFSGVRLLSLGIIGEYLGRVFEEAKRRPNFLVAEEVDHGRLPPGEGRSAG